MSYADVLARLLNATVLRNPYIPHNPTPKQAEFLLAPEREVFYGGAVGGGKSDALLMAALQYAQVPGYNAILLRRNYADLNLPGALMSRAREWLADTDARWSPMDKTWYFPSGATLSFGYMQNDDDRFRYRSAEFQFVGWDEGTDFTEVQYTYLLSRLRRLDGVTVPIRSRMGSNPDGPGSGWVQERFVPLNEDTGNPEPWRNPPGRRFIPSGLDDNPYLDTREYERALDNLDVVTRKQLREGRWDVRNLGGMLDRSMFEVIDPRDVPHLVDRVRGWDLAGTKPVAKNADPDWTRGVLQGIDADGVKYLLDLASCREEPGGVRELVQATARADGVDVRIVLPQDPGQAGKDQVRSYAKHLSGYATIGLKITQNKRVMATPWAADAGNGLYRVVRAPWNRAFFTEVEAFPQKGVHDDIVDAVSVGHRVLGARSWRAA
jgi:predicted phage terminase large subunit-like protein